MSLERETDVKTGSPSEAFETRITGPLLLGSDARTLTWLASAGPAILGSVKLVCEKPQVAQMSDLIVVSANQRTWQAISARLLAAIAEYGREHAILKLKVNKDSRFDWVPQQLTRYGYHDADSARMEFYLDLYYRPGHQRRSHVVKASDQPRMAC